jgi:hypothetical protein
MTTLRIDDATAAEGLSPVRKLLYLVLLLAVKDRATEVRFEPASDRWELRYRVAGTVYDMVPPPRFLRIDAEAARLAGLRWWRHPWLALHALVARIRRRPCTLHAEVRLVIADHEVPVKVRIARPATANVVIELSENESAVEAAQRLLTDILGRQGESLADPEGAV